MISQKKLKPPPPCQSDQSGRRKSEAAAGHKLRMRPTLVTAQKKNADAQKSSNKEKDFPKKPPGPDWADGWTHTRAWFRHIRGSCLFMKIQASGKKEGFGARIRKRSSRGEKHRECRQPIGGGKEKNVRDGTDAGESDSKIPAS